tara:strand:+ start:553 stop:963 length:411 start_codon:yes stop_codon:yes gene_type:complete
LNKAKKLITTFIKPILFLIGLLMFVLGIIGIALPGLPTTPFMILAAACFVRSSDRFYKLVINNKIFGKTVSDYRAGKGMPFRIKIIAWVMMWCFGLYAVFKGIPETLLYIRILVFILLIIGTIFIYRVPTKIIDEE